LVRRARDFHGQLYSIIELIIILKMSENGCLISCIAFRSTILAATRSLHSNKRSFQTLNLFLDLQSIVTYSSCSFLTFGSTVTGISSCFVCPPRLNSWHSLPLHKRLQPSIFTASYCSIVAICCYVVSVLNYDVR
jgi:hypothetical protein